MLNRWQTRCRLGAVTVQVAICLTVILGLFGLAFDVIRVHIAAQRAQVVADAAALAGITGLPDSWPLAHGRAEETVDVNNLDASDAAVPAWLHANVDPNADIIHLPPGSTVYAPDGTTAVTTLGPYAQGIKVRALVRVPYTVAQVIGLQEGVRVREATAIVGPPASPVPITPIWISKATRPDLFPGEDFICRGPDGPDPPDCPYGYVGPGEWTETGQLICPLCGALMGPAPGDLVELVYDDVAAQDPDYELPFGSFGFLDVSVPGEDWFAQLLRGYNVSDSVYDAARVAIGDTVYAYPGVNAGPWDHALGDETGQDDGTSRLERATNPDYDWSTETWDNHDETSATPNPRIMLVPVVEYNGLQGANASFTVVSFALMWLEDVISTGSDKGIIVRFLEFQQFTGMDVDPTGNVDFGIYVRKLIL